jgi:hypothetical protein
MQVTKKIIRVAGVAALVLVAASASAKRHEEAFDRTMAFNPGARLVVDNQNGSVTVESWDRNEVRIRATKYVDAGSREHAAEVMAALKIEVNDSPGLVEVRTITPRRSGGGFWGWMTGGDGNYGVTYTITVPKSANLDIDTVNGRVVVRKVSGVMSLGSTNGRIEVHEGSGRVDASTTNGRIYAQLLRVDRGGMRFSTTNGGVEIELPESIAANLDVSTTNGSINTDFPITVSGTFNKNRLSGVVNGGGESLRVRTTNGSVRISKING